MYLSCSWDPFGTLFPFYPFSRCLWQSRLSGVLSAWADFFFLSAERDMAIIRSDERKWVGEGFLRIREYECARFTPRLTYHQRRMQVVHELSRLLFLANWAKKIRVQAHMANSDLHFFLFCILGMLIGRKSFTFFTMEISLSSKSSP